MHNPPVIIQGGMGAGVSSWRLARAVSRLGQLGVVSGTALDQILARRLQDGDPGGHMRRALEHFPNQEMARRIREKFYIPGGKPQKQSYRLLPLHSKDNAPELTELCIVANFAEVFLAREGHGNPVGINYLEKIQIPHLPSIYGAMLAGVEYVLMGAGIPLKIPGVLDHFVNHQAATYPLHVTGAAAGEDTTMKFDPAEFLGRNPPELRRPKFLPIVSSATLALTLQKKANGRVDGFIVEGHTAGGHNAPPRGVVQHNQRGEPIYGERDRADLEKIAKLELPFWLAGGYGTREKLREAKERGAAGVQVGTAFAFCEESDLKKDYKEALLRKAVEGTAQVFTDPVASPTGFPFKVAQLEGSLSELDVYEARPRICDLGYLREAYKKPDGTIDYRCPGEPVSLYVSKGGRAEDTRGRKCVCNALVANIGHAQVRNAKYVEVGLVTSGDDLSGIGRFVKPGEFHYTAEAVLSHLLGAGGRDTG